ncbi:MAG TPA: 1,4-alpha-glucan branching protein GlgB [Candidatus Elarobacter sp.]|jgi:1,4-alpha-glucan branching enzyme|nr:1,4-alpha-glucan branching protein GlgB [Candidatus Elarobacter sp.]
MIAAEQLDALEHGREGDPFALLGPHALGTGTVVRAFVPGARAVRVVDEDGRAIAEAEPVGKNGLFEAYAVALPPSYKLQIDDANGTRTIEDPYRFGPILGDLDAWLFAQGNHHDLYRVLGAHPDTIDGVRGTRFAVWAPNASRVSVVGDWNDWDGRVHPMRLRREAGVWEIFLPGVEPGARYKYELLGPNGALLPLRADPFAFRGEKRPANASVVTAPSAYEWHDEAWLQVRGEKQRRDAPIQIYEVHLGSWKRVPEDGDRFLTYRELAEQLVPYVKDLGFTHIELLPITEHPFDLSWGYQTTSWFAPTSRFGEPDDFRAFVDAAHAAGIGVILDWVPGHFPTDAHALGTFDGTPLYEHADPREGFHREWGTYVFNLGRNEVQNFLIASALYWLREFHVDGLRVDAVASILYRDYSRKEGEWIPNRYGGRENLEAVAFLRRLNATLYGEVPGIATFAEESTAWPGVTIPVEFGGLGFGYKWNMGWMHDTLDFLERDPLFRGHHLNEISFGLVYAFSENFVLPLSHDEVVHGKRSLLGRMPGNDEQQFANLRLLYGLMWAHPGKKLLFAGGEFAQRAEWRAQASLDWHLTRYAPHHGVQQLVHDANRIAREHGALHERDCEPSGFEWVAYDDWRNAVVAFIRWDAARDGHVVCAFNFSGARHEGYVVGVPRRGEYRELLNTDSSVYGGAGVGNGASVTASDRPAHGRPFSLSLTLPPLTAIWLAP